MSTPALVLFHLGPDPWIEERVQDINDDVHQRYGNGGVNHAAHNGRDVRDELFIDDVGADSADVEYLLRNGGAAEHSAELKSDDRNDRNDGVTDSMLHQNGALAEPLRFGCDHVIFINNLQRRGASFSLPKR